MTFLAAQEPTSSAAAEHIDEVTQAHTGAGIHVEVEALVVSRGTAVGLTAIFHSVQLVNILLVPGVHADGPLHVFQRRDLIAQALVGQGT